MRFALTVLALIPLAACTGIMAETYQQEYDRLDQSCQDRGGILAPAPGGTTGRPSTDYLCEIRDGGRLAAEQDD